MPNRLVEMTLGDFAERLAGGDPAPGGGSAAALTGVLAAALTAMVARLTIGRSRYARHEAEMLAIRDRADGLRNELLTLVDADTAAYQTLMDAYRLPRENRSAKLHRQRAIQEGLRRATDIPLATAEACAQVLNLTAQAKEHGNRNAVGDAAVAALLAHGAMLGGIHDVRINLNGLEDPDFRAQTEARLASMLDTGEAALRRALEA